jgi:hypothetical protein
MRLEKRKANRVVLSVPIQYKVFQLDNLEKSVQDQALNRMAEIQNVSLSGIQVVSPGPFRPGDVMELELEIPGRGSVRSVAKVIWCQPNPAAGPSEYRSGIQFIPVYEEDLHKLQDYLKPGN